MTGLDLNIQLANNMKMLTEKVAEYESNNIEFAQAEHEYRLALSKEYLIKRAEGFPVTIISDVCRGLPNIAELRLRKDIAEGKREATKEAIQSCKLQIRVLDAQIAREWGK